MTDEAKEIETGLSILANYGTPMSSAQWGKFSNACLRSAATIRALQEEVGEMREEYTPKHAAWDAACSVPRKVQKKIAAALIFAANVKYNLDQGAWADCPERYRAEFYRFAEDIQATLKDTPND